MTISTRENSSIKKLGDFEFENLEFKENAYDKKILDKLNEYDYILISVPPINSNDLFLKNLDFVATEYPISGYELVPGIIIPHTSHS